MIGPNVEEWGTRFPDMSTVYDKELQEILRQTAKEYDIPLKEGVYIQLTGPSFESPAEIRIVRTLGADAVGMSTVVKLLLQITWVCVSVVFPVYAIWRQE